MFTQEGWISQRGWVYHGVGTHSWDIGFWDIPGVLTPSGGHQNTCGWQADGKHPTEHFLVSAIFARKFWEFLLVPTGPRNSTVLLVALVSDRTLPVAHSNNSKMEDKIQSIRLS